MQNIKRLYYCVENILSGLQSVQYVAERVWITLRKCGSLFFQDLCGDSMIFNNWYQDLTPLLHSKVWLNMMDVPNANLFYDLVFAAMILMYLTYTWGNSVHQQSKRKNPADYENDE